MQQPHFAIMDFMALARMASKNSLPVYDKRAGWSPQGPTEEHVRIPYPASFPQDPGPYTLAHG